MGWSAHYEIDFMAFTFYLNELCFLSELCDNADELWTLKRGEPWVCKHTPAGEARLKDSLKTAYNSAENHPPVPARMLQGGHVATTAAPAKEVSTMLSASMPLGATQMEVADATGLEVGDKIFVDAGETIEEEFTISSITAVTSGRRLAVTGKATIAVAPASKFNHAPGAPVQTKKAAPVVVTTAAPQTSPEPVNPCAPVPVTSTEPANPCAVAVPVPTPAPTTPAPAPPAPANPCAVVTTPPTTPAPTTPAPKANPCAVVTTPPTPPSNPCATVKLDSERSAKKAQAMTMLQRMNNLAPGGLAVLGFAMAAFTVGMLARNIRKQRQSRTYKPLGSDSIPSEFGQEELQECSTDATEAPLLSEP
jgi:hypothetical protein